jgi:hypothetical protein
VLLTGIFDQRRVHVDACERKALSVLHSLPSSRGQSAVWEKLVLLEPAMRANVGRILGYVCGVGDEGDDLIAAQPWYVVLTLEKRPYARDLETIRCIKLWDESCKLTHYTATNVYNLLSPKSDQRSTSVNSLHCACVHVDLHVKVSLHSSSSYIATATPQLGTTPDEQRKEPRYRLDPTG